jgi:2-succinyl-6-hydroxy-2,4-cyclohexadiene-1-carboxylate synthase
VPEHVVLLHGFGGTHRAWDGVTPLLDRERYLPLALDLPGHGVLAGERPLTFDGAVASVLARAPERFLLCGYSLGGRIAQHVALAAPDRVAGLLLVSTSAGIDGAADRAARVASDERLARELEVGPFATWVERWRTQPLFAGEPERVRELASADQLRNDPRALAAALRGLGAGRMQPLWPRLGELRMPALVLAGERDQKFVAIGRWSAAALGDGELEVVPGGHGVPLENPAAVASAIGALARRLSPQAR